MNQEKIGKFIAKLRKEKNITQEQLAEILGVNAKSISRWENGKNMPDLSLFKPLCDEFNITINDLINGEVIQENEYREKAEENMIDAIEYSRKKIQTKNIFIGLVLIFFGIFLSITAISIFESESSWSSIYSILGVIISLLGIDTFIKKLTLIKRIVCDFSYFVIFLALLLAVDYIGVINIKQAPRFSIVKVTGDNAIYYDTLFYDVIRCNKNRENETFKVIKNHKYKVDEIDNFCE